MDDLRDMVRHSRGGFTLSRLRRAVLLGFKSLWLHRLRSLLTVLGIVFGVCSVIAMLAVGEGASFEAQEQIRRLGSNNIIIRSKRPTGTKNLGSQQSFVLPYGITYADVDRIKGSIPGVRVVVPGRIIKTNIWHLDKRVDGEVVGSVYWYPRMRNLKLLKGRFFSQLESLQKANVCVLDEKTAGKLFPITSPVGNSVRVGSDYYRVVGVIEAESRQAGRNNAGTKHKGESKGSASVATARAYIPLSAAKDRFGEVLVKRNSGSIEATRVELHEAVVEVKNKAEVEETARIVDEILARNHKKRDYEIVVPLAELRAAKKMAQVFNLVLGSIAAISLIVGGIGIMNIMLASVTERTREIGIRRALGARRRDIIMQFLVETVILSGIGGLIGVALGIVIPYIITAFAGMITIITPWSPLMAFGISGLVGVIFGIYPAIRAANMDPVEALRHE